MRKRLPVMVADDKAGVLFLDGPRRREAAGGHGLKDQFFDLIQQEFSAPICLLGANGPPRGTRYDHCGLCDTRYFDRRCHGERVFRIFGAQVLIFFPILLGLALLESIDLDQQHDPIMA
jgi:hypothetical protein